MGFWSNIRNAIANSAVVRDVGYIKDETESAVTSTPADNRVDDSRIETINAAMQTAQAQNDYGNL